MGHAPLPDPVDSTSGQAETLHRCRAPRPHARSPSRALARLPFDQEATMSLREGTPAMRSQSRLSTPTHRRRSPPRGCPALAAVTARCSEGPPGGGVATLEREDLAGES